MLFQTLDLCGAHWCKNPFLLLFFMKGLFNICPTQPHYSYTWDVSKVLSYLETVSIGLVVNGTPNIETDLNSIDRCNKSLSNDRYQP